MTFKNWPSIYQDKTVIEKDTCTPTFTAALFTITKTWKQPKCPLTEEWIKKIPLAKENGYSNVEYYSVIKKNDIIPFATT